MTDIASLRILALGGESSEAYRPIADILRTARSLCFRWESTFARDPADAANEIRQLPIDAVFMPNPYGRERRLEIYRALKRIGFPTIVFDRGGLPNSWFFDVGFNADSPTYGLRNWDRPLDELAQDEIREYIKELRRGTTALERQGTRVGAARLRDTLGIRGKVLFVPFQRPSDAVVKYFSGDVDGFSHFIQEIKNVHRQLSPSDWTIIAKKHPLETVVADLPFRVVPDDTHINDLLELADAVCVINSGVGLLASLFNKPVYHFGKVYYSHPQLNRRVGSSDEVVHHLENGLLSVDEGVRDRLVHHLRSKVYSFGHLNVDVVEQKDGSLRGKTTKIEFDVIRLPDLKPSPARVLFVTSVIPVPINRGSAQRTDQAIRALLANGANIHLLVVNRSERATKSEAIASRLHAAYPTCEITVLPHPEFAAQAKKISRRLYYYRHVARRLWDKVTFGDWRISNWHECPANQKARIKRLLGSGAYDIFWSNYAKTTPLDGVQFAGRKICDTHDLQTLRVSNELDREDRPQWIRSLHLKLFERSERKALQNFDALIAISDTELQTMKEFAGPAIDVVYAPASLVVASEREQRKSYDKCGILFVGSNSTPNEDGLLWFINEIYPKIDDAPILRVVGRICSSKEVVKAALKFPSIELLGFVKDVQAQYAVAQVVVCPIRYGTGMKIKTVEALAHGASIVGTPTAFDSVCVVDRQSAMIAQTPQDFADKIIQLMSDEELSSSISSGARNVFSRDHDFEAFSRTVGKLIELPPR